MNSSKLYITIYALGLLFLMSNSTAKSNNFSLRILDKSPIDLCGKEFERQVVIAPYMGAVKKSDSIVGYEVSISYDPKVVRMNQKLFINTLAGKFNYKELDFFPETNEIVFDGIVDLKGNLNPVSGDLPLFAVAGDFIGKCGEEAIFKVNYYKFYGFNGTIDSTSGVTIKGNIVEKPNRVLGFNLTKDIRSVKKDSTIGYEVDLNMGILDSLDYWKIKLSADNDSLDIQNISTSNNVELLNVTKGDDNGYLLELKVNNTESPKLFFDVKSYKVDSTVFNLELETVETTECICATSFLTSSIVIKNLETKKIDSTTSIVEQNKETDFYVLNNKIVAMSNIDIEVYNISGVQIDKRNCNINEVYNTEQSTKGIYFIKITSKDVIKTIKIINN